MKLNKFELASLHALFRKSTTLISFCLLLITVSCMNKTDNKQEKHKKMFVENCSASREVTSKQCECIFNEVSKTIPLEKVPEAFSDKNGPSPEGKAAQRNAIKTCIGISTI